MRAAATATWTPRRRDVHFALERAVPTVILECEVHLSAMSGPVAVVADRGAASPSGPSGPLGPLGPLGPQGFPW